MAEYRTPTVEEMQEEGTIFEALVPYPLKKENKRRSRMGRNDSRK